MPSTDTETVVVGMSGGVDSSVSAALLLEQGYKVIGLFMKNWEEDDDDECNATEDLADAQAVCDTLEIPLKTVNFSFEYWERVFAGFLRDLRLGKTPNPDIICNVEIKFREFPQWAIKLGADYVATGHYARIGCNNGTLNLLKGVDQDKDQTYFLYGLKSDALQRALFPIGNLTKQQVRSKALQFGFENHDKKGSTGICFIGRRNFRSFVRRYVDSTEGLITNPQGTVLGRHEGAFLYTIGQRTGLGIGGPGDAWYVASKNVSTNTVVAVQGHDHPLLFSQSANLSKLNWISGRYELPHPARAKVRYRGEDQNCEICHSGDRGYFVEFEKPVRAVTPGQSIVFYDDVVCLGGAVIESTVT